MGVSSSCLAKAWVVILALCCIYWFVGDLDYLPEETNLFGRLMNFCCWRPVAKLTTWLALVAGARLLLSVGRARWPPAV